MNRRLDWYVREALTLAVIIGCVAALFHTLGVI